MNRVIARLPQRLARSSLANSKHRILSSSSLVSLHTLPQVRHFKTSLSTSFPRRSDTPPPTPPSSPLPPNNNNNNNNDDESGDSKKPALTHPTIPQDYPQLLAIPLTRRPLFPGFYKSLYISDPNVISAIQSLLDKHQPYIGIFLSKDDTNQKDVIEPGEVYETGIFAQITNIYSAGVDNKSLTVVVYPHRRIKINDFVTPDHAHDEQTTSEKYSEINKHLLKHNVTVVNVSNLRDAPYVPENPTIKAISSEMLSVLKEISQINPLLRDQIITFSIQTGGNAFADPAKLADFAAAVSSGEPSELQGVLEAEEIEDRLHKALVVLKKELANARLQQEIAKEVDKKITRKQQEYFLTEQLKGIKKELGLDTDGKEKLVEKFKKRAEELKMPDAVKKVFEEELSKLQHLEAAASEFNVTRNYLDWLTQIPWGKYSKENFNIKNAQKVLDEDHYGLKDVKDRILEFIAVGRLRGTVEGKIICLVGPPGVGKTSVGKSIARALGREFFRFSVGGLTDVAEIKGHRRTYVGAMPGKVVQALKKVQTENPLIMIDEIDKLGRGHQGDPASALLELLDPEQNSSFLDHYMDVPIDLSKVLFVCTANMLDTIPPPLLDRMEVITLSGYVSEEKVAIAKQYLSPTAKQTAGLENWNVQVTDEAIESLIRNYCRESGVRNLKKQIEKIYRKAAFEIVKDEPEAVVDEVKEVEEKAPVEEMQHKEVVIEAVPESESQEGESTSENTETENVVDEQKPTAEEEPVKVPERDPRQDTFTMTITPDNLKDFVGSPLFTSDRMYDTTPPGVVMGLAWTSMGGSALYIESVLESAITDNSKPSFQRTGQLGNVMNESAGIAYTYAKSLIASKFPNNKFFEKGSIHMHVPEGATPKDGPSAGCTITTSLLSLALNYPVPANLAMTGEITLTGKILKIGGVKEKTIAAKRSGVKMIIFPKANQPDWDELADYIKEGLQPKFVDWYTEIFEVVFKDYKEE